MRPTCICSDVGEDEAAGTLGGITSIIYRPISGEEAELFSEDRSNHSVFRLYLW